MAFKTADERLTVSGLNAGPKAFNGRYASVLHLFVCIEARGPAASM